ncbi:MAG: aconitate hydratase [Nitrospirae bacterium]|nr:aconitate hydratase [Nitrospirota bacterium]
MLIDINDVKQLYARLDAVHAAARKRLGRPLTMAEKVLFSHMDNFETGPIQRGKDDVWLRPDRVAMQDATAQMAILQFMTAGMPRTAVPSTVHCDHLITAYKGSAQDLLVAEDTNKEVYDFLHAASQRYGMGFWKPGSGIIHQVVLENYAVPGMMMIGTDSHTPNAGGMGMIAIGVGGADAVDVMTGQPFLTRMPKLVGIKLTGKLSGWTSPKDVILKVAQIMTVKGGTGKIVEYFGPGAASISASGKGTITNMGAEIGATTSMFGYDAAMGRYLRATERAAVADLADRYARYLTSDPEVEANPGAFYDELHEINLSELEPHVVGPHTPDLARPISALAAETDREGYPERLTAALIGSCTNSSYEDMTRAASIAKQAAAHGIKAKSSFMISPGSERVHETIIRDGIMETFNSVGGIVLSNSCGPCIGQWKRDDVKKGDANSIITSFNRNFKARNDSNPETRGFIASPEIVVAMGLAGSLKFNPLTDTLKGADGAEFKLRPPVGEELPSGGFISKDAGYVAPVDDAPAVQVSPSSDRLALLEPFPKLDPVADYKDMPVLVKALGKCTTDHVSPAGPWLKYRGHLDNISNNMYIGAVNAFTQEAGKGGNVLTGQTGQDYNQVARDYKARGIGWVVIADENYGEGSSREHAAMEPRHLNGRAVIARSFARIAEANLKKQGILPLWFANAADYDKVREDDRITLEGLAGIAPDQPLTMVIRHADGHTDRVGVTHTLNDEQITWFRAGSALNAIREAQDRAARA